MLSSLAHAFDGGDNRPSTLKDVSFFERRLGSATADTGTIMDAGTSSIHMPWSSSSPSSSSGAGNVSLQAGSMFVHEQRVEVPLPRFQPLPLTGVSIVDAEFRRRSEMFVQEMHREFSAFSLTGLTWLEQRAKEDAQVATERAAEDAAIARRRAEEDGALAARRQRADLERRKAGTFEKEREAQETQLISRWKSKSGELQASLKEAVASYEAHKALEAQRLKEDVARASAEAARNADLEVERAIRTAEQAEEARLKAELDKLRMSTTPSVRSLTLVGAQQVAPALRYAVGVVGGPLRLKDRSWWKLLHTLECEGLTPRTEPRLDLDLTSCARSLSCPVLPRLRRAACSPTHLAACLCWILSSPSQLSNRRTSRRNSLKPSTGTLMVM